MTRIYHQQTILLIFTRNDNIWLC